MSQREQYRLAQPGGVGGPCTGRGCRRGSSCTRVTSAQCLQSQPGRLVGVGRRRTAVYVSSTNEAIFVEPLASSTPGEVGGLTRRARRGSFMCTSLSPSHHFPTLRWLPPPPWAARRRAAFTGLLCLKARKMEAIDRRLHLRTVQIGSKSHTAKPSFA